MTDLRRAWAVLGLRPSSSLEATRTAYRQLAKRWHPDRFANDPVGQGQASDQMAVINGAYRQVIEAGIWHVSPPQSESTKPVGRRLSREEIDRFVASMGSDTWVDAPFCNCPSCKRGWVSYDPSEDQWAITPGVAFGLVFCLGMFVVGVLEWSGHPPSPEWGKVAAIAIGACSLIASLAVGLRRGW